jgi:hypothetical protein
MSEFESSSSGSVVTTTRGFAASDADGALSPCRAAVEQPRSAMPSSAPVIERNVVIAESLVNWLSPAPAVMRRTHGRGFGGGMPPSVARGSTRRR